MNKEDVINAYKSAGICKNAYRNVEGRKLLQEMIDSKYAPDVFIDICIRLNIDSVSFLKDTYSGDYMPDFGWFISLDRNKFNVMPFLYESTETYTEFADFFGDEGIDGQDDTRSALESNGIPVSNDEALEIFEFVTGFGEEGLRREMYDYEGSEFS